MPTPAREPDLADPVEAARVTRALLENAITRHGVSDRPVGVFLSGGLDSGAVATLATRDLDRVRALTVTFPDSPAASEGQSAARVAAAIGAEHIEVPCTGAEVARLLPEVLGAMDQPSSDAVNTWIVCRAAREAGRVVCLSGLGGDEVFGGYPTFTLVPKLARMRSALRMVPSYLLRHASVAVAERAPGGRLARVLHAAPSLVGAYEAVRSLFTPSEVSALLNGEDGNAPGPSVDGSLPPAGSSDVEVVAFLELTRYLPRQLLRDTDSVSMAHSLEVRVPLLDDLVVDLVLRIPEPVRFAPRKALLAAAARCDPDSAKQPFTLPFDSWLHGPLKESVREALLSEELPLGKVLSAGGRRRLWTACVEGRTHWSRPWAVAMLRLWPVTNGFDWR